MNQNMKKNHVRTMVLAAMCVAIGIFLPFLTGQIPEIGSRICPMHIPILLCGFMCGWQYGLVAGFITPLLRSALFGMPPIMPVGLAMAFELAAYGLFTGIFYRLLPKKGAYVYVTLIVSMLLGRVVWGVADAIILGATGGSLTFAAFIAGGFTNAIPGIILHIAIIPPIVLALKKAKVID
jgi:thiamine transporter ThiT